MMTSYFNFERCMSNLELRFSRLQTENCGSNRKKVALDLWNSSRMSIYARTCTHAQLLASISGLLIYPE